MALVVVDPGHQVGGEVDDLLELLGLELFLRLDAGQQVGEPRPGAAQVPDVHHRCLQLDVAHPLPTHLRAGHLDAAALADDPLEAHPLVLAAVALPVTSRSEDLLAEQAVLLRAQRAVVDRLRLLHLAVRPRADLIRGGQPDLELVEHVHVKHFVSHCVRWSVVADRSSSALVARIGGRFSSSCLSWSETARSGALRARRRPRRCPAPGGRCRCRAPRQRGTRPRRGRGSRSRCHRRRAPRR